MRLTALAIALAVGLAVLPGAQPQASEPRGFNPDSVRARLGGELAVDATARARARRLDPVTQALRLNLARDTDALVAALDADEQAIARAVLAPGSQAAWRYFFAGSIVLVGGIAGETVRVGYYNPILDAFVLADLRDTGSSFRLVGMTALSGAAMRGQPPTASLAPGWVRVADTPVAVAMIESARSAAEAFERRHALHATTLPALDPTSGLVARRARFAITQLASVATDPDWSAALAAVDPGPGVAAGAQPVAAPPHPALAGLPVSMTGDLRLAALLKRPQDSVAVFHSPQAPRLILFVDVAEGGEGVAPTLGKAALADVLATREAQ